MSAHDFRVRETNEAPAFRVHLVTPSEAKKYARPIIALTNQAWRFRLGSAIPSVAIDAKTSPDIPKNVQRVADGIEGKTKPIAQYNVAIEEGSDDTVLGFVRIATYVPRIRFKPNYPDVTDLEVIPPTSQHSIIGGALLYFGLKPFDSKQKISLYSEQANEEGNAWFEQIGLETTGLTPTEELTSGAITYVQYGHDRNGVARVRDALLDEYPSLKFLRHNGE